MNRAVVVLLAMGYVTLGFARPAFPWGSAVHAYVANHVGKQSATRNLNEMYGAIAPDLFNSMFGDPRQEALSMATHYRFSSISSAARLALGKALALGFVSHNEAWGADHTAHIALERPAYPRGYVIERAEQLKDQFLAPLLASTGLVLPDNLVMSVAHYLTELGVDVLLKDLAPGIGYEIVFATLLRSPEWPLMLTRAYSAYFGGSPGALEELAKIDQEFRRNMMSYGVALMRDRATAVRLIAEQMAASAPQLLAQYGVPPLPQANLIALIQAGIRQAMELCQDDYAQALEETIRVVTSQLSAHGIKD